MNINLSAVELEELKELVEYSINKITVEIQHTQSVQNKVELKNKKEELNQILAKIESLEKKQAA